MINLTEFSLGKVQVTVERYTGAYTSGIYAYTLDSSFTIWASVQPYSTIEAEQVMEARMGQRVERMLLIYTAIPVFQNADDATNPTRDLIVIDNVKYKPVRVETWDHLSLGHYRVILKKYDGD